MRDYRGPGEAGTASEPKAVEARAPGRRAATDHIKGSPGMVGAAHAAERDAEKRPDGEVDALAEANRDSDSGSAREVSDVEARAGALQVRDYIKAQAQIRAQEPRALDPESMLYKRLEGHYLKDYLAEPSPAAGKRATEEIGKPFTGPATPGDYWEESSLTAFNQQSIPAGFRQLRPGTPGLAGAATDSISVANRKEMDHLDSPHLLGNANISMEKDADVTGGGKNISQVMHWATGVKHGDVDPSVMRELFLAYELFHLEGWDKFAEDPINDLIAEDAGRIMGRQLQGGEINKGNLGQKLDQGFAEARAWAGSLLRIRQAELDAWIVAEDPAVSNSATIWWNEDDRWNVWGPDNIFSMLKAGHSVQEVQDWHMTQRIADIYTLVYEVEVWEKQHGPVQNSGFTEAMASGEMNPLFKKSAKGEPLTTGDKLGAWNNANRPAARNGAGR